MPLLLLRDHFLLLQGSEQTLPLKQNTELSHKQPHRTVNRFLLLLSSVVVVSTQPVVGTVPSCE